MWKRKELKAKARKVVKKNYWTAIAVCFLIALLTGEFGTSIIGIWQTEDSMDPYYIINHKNMIMKEQVEEEEQQVQGKIEEKKITLNDTQKKIWKAIEANLDSATKSQKYIFKIWDAIESFNIHQAGLGIGISITALLSFIFTIVIADPLIVSEKRYFLKARKKSNTKITVIGEIFKKERWFNIIIIMLLRNIYNFLWYLTIIGGIIKTYEYKMIPYILAENPKIERKKAFQLSKEMMRGNKWRTFILDMSFWGWSLVSIFTFGLLNILYINPYKSATKAELYIVLKHQAIKKKYEYYEELNDRI